MILQYLPCHTTSNSTEAFQTLLKLTKAIWNQGQKIYVANWFTSKHIRQLLDETLWRRCNDSTKYESVTWHYWRPVVKICSNTQSQNIP